MKNPKAKYVIPITLLAVLALVPRRIGLSDGQKVRPPGVAGSFYPADPKELTQMIDSALAHASPPKLQEPLVALICPHAGYIYTAPVAGACYAELKGRKYARVIVIAPSHFEGFPFASIYDGDAYSTPLGTVPLDKAFGAKLTQLSHDIKISERGHVPVRDPSSGQMMSEHALEVQLPFLQRTLGEFKLVPIVMGDQDYGLCRSLGLALAKALLAEKPEERAQTLILVSSDLSHYHPYDEAVQIDHHTLQAIEEWDYLSLWRNFATRTWEACGGGPIVAAMIAAERLGATHAQVLKYANSGDTAGEKSRVVGYGAVAITRQEAEPAKKSAEFSLTGKEKDELLKIARRSVETAVRERKMYLVGSTGFPRLEEDRGAFVTLKEHGELRGCIGYITPVKPLAETVRDVAAYAALEDHRFQPVSTAELPLLQYEVSVLSPLRRVLDIKQIKVGRDGLIMKKGDIEGLLLPQVPVEEHWDRETFLEQTCIKAGLPPQAWKDDDTDIFRFTALVFGGQIPIDASLPDQPTVPNQRSQPGMPGLDLPRP
jgi:AmmeMemoRadiSam system protein B/AmmeMemoRadiSam system protein A